MICENCENELDYFHFLALKNYEISKGNKTLKMQFNFCSSKCMTQFIGKYKDNTFKDFDPYEISRCGGYKDCEKINNLRRMCETSKQLNVKSSIFNPGFMPTFYCKPGELGIIRASLKLMDILESFDEKYQASSREMSLQSQEMIKHSRDMKWLTVFIAVFTVANLIILIFQ